MSTVTLLWDDLNTIEYGHKIYRDTAPLDINNLPQPIAVLGNNIDKYIDDTVTVGTQYYYVVSAYIPYGEEYSIQYSVVAVDSLSIYVNTTSEIVKIDGNGAIAWTLSLPNKNHIAVTSGGWYVSNGDILERYDDQGILINTTVLPYIIEGLYSAWNGNLWVIFNDHVSLYNNSNIILSRYRPNLSYQNITNSGSSLCYSYGNIVEVINQDGVITHRYEYASNIVACTVSDKGVVCSASSDTLYMSGDISKELPFYGVIDINFDDNGIKIFDSTKVYVYDDDLNYISNYDITGNTLYNDDNNYYYVTNGNILNKITKLNDGVAWSNTFPDTISFIDSEIDEKSSPLDVYEVGEYQLNPPISVGYTESYIENNSAPLNFKGTYQV